ncbi:MAG: hypothetical protein GXY77_14565, partial [Fibrobacter sp.]|nr:hypothetical protein [Fibrobacter sp.]
MLLRRDQVPFPNNPACKQCANKPCHQLFAGPIYPGKIIFVHRSKFVRLPCYAPSLEEENENKKEPAPLTDDLEVITGQLEISNPKWEHTTDELKRDSADKAVIGDLIELRADIKNYPEKAKVTFDIYDVSSNTPLRITSVESKNENGVAKAQWTVEDPEQKGENLKLAFEAIARSKASSRVEVPMIPKINCDFVEAPDILFHHNSAVPCLDQNGTLIDSLTSVFKYAKENKDKEIVLFGHTDTSGDPDYNYDLSQWRVEGIKALLDNNVNMWLDIVELASRVEDYQTILKSLCDSYGWPTDPGAVDNTNSQKTIDAVKAFQSEYNTRFNSSLKEDGVVGSKTWEAIFEVIRNLLVESVKGEIGEEPSTLVYSSNHNGVYPCGESFPVDQKEKNNYSSLENRRVEIVFFDKGKAPELIEPENKKQIKKSEVIVYDERVTEKKPVKRAAKSPDETTSDLSEESAVFYAPGRDEYFVVEPSDIDALVTEIDELEQLSEEIRLYRESFANKRADEKMTKAANEIQQKVEEKFDGLTKEPSKAIQELLLVKSNKKTGKIKNRVYIRPYKATNRQVRGHWRKHNDKTVEKLLKKWLKKEPAAGKSKVETRLKTVLFQTEKIDEQWPWKWKFDKKGGKDTAAGYFGGAYDIQFFRFVAGARGEADFDLTDKKLTLGADAGISYGIADGSIKGEWGLPDQDGFNLYDHLLLSPKARESIKPNYECRFRFNIKTEGKLFAGVSLSAVVALPCIDFGDEKSGIFGGSVGGFAGGSAEGKLVTEIVWSKEKAAAFNLLAGFGGNAAGNVGIGAEGKFEFRYENGKVKFVSGAMLTYGIGAKAGLVFELDVNK